MKTSTIIKRTKWTQTFNVTRQNVVGRLNHAKQTQCTRQKGTFSLQCSVHERSKHLEWVAYNNHTDCSYGMEDICISGRVLTRWTDSQVKHQLLSTGSRLCWRTGFGIVNNCQLSKADQRLVIGHFIGWTTRVLKHKKQTPFMNVLKSSLSASQTTCDLKLVYIFLSTCH